MRGLVVAVVGVMVVSSVGVAEGSRLKLHCTELDPGAGYPAVVNIVEKNGTEIASVYPHSYADVAEPTEYVLTKIEENGPETWYYGKDFTLRFDPTVNEGTLMESVLTGQIELHCETR